MNAKQSRKGATPAASPPPAATPPSPARPSAPSATGIADASAGGFTPWIDSPDPRKRTLGKVVLAGVWIYIAALCLLALDQTFSWGIFGPKVPALP